MAGKIKNSSSDRIFMGLNYTFLSIILLMVLYPLVYILSSSLSSTYAVSSGRVWLWPVETGLAGYKAVFKNNQVMTGYYNSAYYTIAGTTINVVMTVLAAYPLSRRKFRPRNFLMMLFTFTMLFSGGLIPYYLVVKSLNLLDTRWAMVIPNAMAVYQVIVARTFFQSTIPEELYESADIDGSSILSTFLRIVLPLSSPIIAVLTLMYAVGHWNSFFNALIFLQTPRLYSLQIILRNILIQNTFDMSALVDVREAMVLQGMQELLKYSLIVVACAPVLALYPFVQKYFIKGIMIGAIKG